MNQLIYLFTEHTEEKAKYTTRKALDISHYTPKDSHAPMLF